MISQRIVIVRSKKKEWTILSILVAMTIIAGMISIFEIYI